MELRLKHWALISALGFASIGVASMPFEFERRIPSTERSQPFEDRIVEQVKGSIQTTRDHIFLAEQAIRLRELATDNSSGLVFDFNFETLPVNAGVRIAEQVEDFKNRIQFHATSDQKALGGEHAFGGVGVSVVDGINWRQSGTAIQYYEFDIGGEHQCFAQYTGFFNYFLSDNDPLSEPPSPIGACWVSAKHGAPGPLIGEWFRRWGAGLAQPTRENKLTGSPPVTAFDLFDGIAMGLLGGGFSGFKDKCLVGYRQACVMNFLGTPSNEFLGFRGIQRGDLRQFEIEGGRHYTMTVYRYKPFFSYGRELLNDLETEFGEERFAAFWKSDQPVEAAFETAFGIDVGEWVYGWATERLGKQNRGPRMPWTSYVWTIGLAVVAAGATAKRYNLKTV